MPYSGKDPRFREDYDDFSIVKKCQAMVDYLSHLVDNMRECMGTIWQDPTGAVADGSHVGDWGMGNGSEPDVEETWLYVCPKRGTLAFNLVILHYAQQGMGKDFYYDDGFLGKDNADIGGGSAYGQEAVEAVLGIYPLKDKDLVSFCQESVHPGRDVVDLLGPTLFQKNWLSAPLSRFFPLESNKINFSSVLALEKVDEGMIQECGFSSRR